MTIRARVCTFMRGTCKTAALSSLAEDTAQHDDSSPPSHGKSTTKMYHAAGYRIEVNMQHREIKFVEIPEEGSRSSKTSHP